MLNPPPTPATRDEAVAALCNYYGVLPSNLMKTDHMDRTAHIRMVTIFFLASLGYDFKEIEPVVNRSVTVCTQIFEIGLSDFEKYYDDILLVRELVRHYVRKPKDPAPA